MAADVPIDAHLSGRVAIIAGSTRGIGLNVAYALAGRGVSLVVNGRDARAVDDTVAEIAGGGGYAVGVCGSAGDEGVAERMVTAALDAFGALDIAVNCAGIAEPAGSTILTITPAEFREQLDAHLMSAFFLTQSAARVFVGQQSGSIVLTGSAASLGTFGGSGYPAAKGGVNALALAASGDLMSSGVRVNVVMPGAKSRLSSGPDYVRHIEACMREAYWTTSPATRRSIRHRRNTLPSSTHSSRAMPPPRSPARSSRRRGVSSVDTIRTSRRLSPTATIKTRSHTVWRSWPGCSPSECAEKIGMGFAPDCGTNPIPTRHLRDQFAEPTSGGSVAVGPCDCGSSCVLRGRRTYTTAARMRRRIPMTPSAIGVQKNVARRV